jgi:hypothetical protein
MEPPCETDKCYFVVDILVSDFEIVTIDVSCTKFSAESICEVAKLRPFDEIRRSRTAFRG